MKIQNRFTAGKFITVHDQLIMDLYKLNTAIPEFTIREVTINNKKYLINSLCGRNGYEIGLVSEVPKELIATGVDVRRFANPIQDQYSSFYDSMEKKLKFSPVEILITNILFSKYLTESYHISRISFKDIEKYRSKASSYRNIVLNDDTATKYVETINSLRSKKIYLKTSETFRDPEYGANSRNLMQPFLTINNTCKAGKNNYSFDYSFGNYGSMIRQSRRFSNLLPNICYGYPLKQANKFVVATFIAQQLFYEKFKAMHAPSNLEYNCIIDYMPICEWTYGSYDITTKKYQRIQDYIENILTLLQSNGEIEKYFVMGKLPKRKSIKREAVYSLITLKTRTHKVEAETT